MFNYQTFLRQQNLQQHISHLRQDLELAQFRRQKSSPQLVHAQKKRVQGFILSAIDKPIPVSQYSNEPPAFRNTNSVGVLASKGFYLRRQSQPERIENQLKKNAQLDAVPFNNTFSHQFRQFHGQGLHFKPFTHNLRVKQFLDRQQLNYLPNKPSKLDRLLKKKKQGQEVDVQKLNHSINKTLLPELHTKTYFKSVATLFTDTPSRGQKVEGALKDEGAEQMDQRRPIKPNQRLLRQNSREALIKCNMLKQKLRG